MQSCERGDDRDEVIRGHHFTRPFFSAPSPWSRRRREYNCGTGGWGDLGRLTLCSYVKRGWAWAGAMGFD